MKKKQKTFGNCGKPLICALLVAAVSDVTDKATTCTIQGTVLWDASLYLSSSTIGFLFGLQHQVFPLI